MKISHKLAIRSTNKKQNRGRILISIFLGLFVIFNPIQNKVFAQNQTNLAVSPFTSEFILNNNSPISILITDGLNVGAFDVDDYLRPFSCFSMFHFLPGPCLSNLFKFYASNTPGRLRVVVATQVSKTRGVTGRWQYCFISVFKGTLPMGCLQYSDFIRRFSTLLVIPLSPILQHGSILVHSDPATTPSRTVTGSFSLQGQPNAAGIPVAFGLGQNSLARALFSHHQCPLPQLQPAQCG